MHLIRSTRCFDNEGSYIKGFLFFLSANKVRGLHIGELMERYGGGGIKGAGTCVLDLEGSDGKIRWIVGGLQAK